MLSSGKVHPALINDMPTQDEDGQLKAQFIFHSPRPEVKDSDCPNKHVPKKLRLDSFGVKIKPSHSNRTPKYKISFRA